MLSKPNTLMTTAWSMLILASIAFGIAVTNKPAQQPKYAERIRTGYVACTSLYFLEQYDRAPHRHQIDMMMADRCLPTDRLVEFDYVVIEGGANPLIRIPLHDGHYAEVYLPVEAVRYVSK